MRKNILVLVFFLITISGFSQNLFIVKNTDYYGVINLNGDLSVPFKYDNIYQSGDYFIVKTNDKFGIIDTTGNEILKCKYFKISYINQNSFVIATEKEKYAVFDVTYNEEPDFKFVFYSKIDLNFSMFLTEDSVLYLINKDDNELIETEFDNFISVITDDKPEEKSSIFGYMNISEENSYFYVSIGNKYGVVDKNLNEILPLEFENIEYENKMWKASLNSKFGIYDLSGNEIIEAGVYSSYEELSENIYLVSNDIFFYGIYNSNLKKETIECEYRSKTYNSDYLILDNFSGSAIIDLNGNLLLKTEYNINNFVNNLIEIQGGSQYPYYFHGLIDFDENVLVKPKFEDIIYLGNNFYLLKNEYNNDKNLITENKNELASKLSFDGFQEKFLLKPNISAICNENGKILFRGSYNDVTYNEVSNVFIVSANNLVSKNSYSYYPKGVINKFGEILLDTIHNYRDIIFDYSEISCYTDSLLYILSLEESGKLIEKVKYKNYVKLNIDTLNIFYWEWDLLELVDEDDIMGYNLYNKFGAPVINNYYTNIDSSFFSNPKFTIAYKEVDTKYLFEDVSKITSKKKYLPYQSTITLINKNTGKIVHSNIYRIDTLEFVNQGSARCFFISKKCALINKNLVKISKDFTYISDFVNGYAVAYYGGEAYFNDLEKFSVDLVQDNDNIFAANSIDFKTEKFHITEAKAGIINYLGDTIVPFNYSYLNIGLKNKIIAANIKIQKNIGVIDLDNNILIPFDYEDIRFFYYTDSNNTYQWFDCEFYMAQKNKKFGVINEGNQIIVNFEYDAIEYLPNEKGSFFAVQKNKKWGLVDAFGNTLIPIIYDEISYLDNSNKNYFKTIYNTDLYGYLNKSLDFQIVPKFDAAEDFKNNFACVRFNNKWNFTDTLGNLLSDTGFVKVNNFSDGKAAVKGKRVWSYIDTSGDLIFDITFDYAGYFYNNSAPVKSNKNINKKSKYGIINQSGEFILNPTYNFISEFTDGFAFFKKKKKYGILDFNGNIIYKPKFKSIEIIENYKIAIAKTFAGDYIILDLDNPDNKLKNNYKEISSFSEGMALVKMNGKYGFIDSTGNLSIEAKYKKAESFSCQMALVQENKLYGFINKKGEVVFDFKFKKAQSFKFGYAEIYENLFITTKGDSIVDFPDLKYYNQKNETGYYVIKNNNYYFYNIDNYDYSRFNKIENAFDNYYLYKDADSKYGIIDFYGNEKVSPCFTLISAPVEDFLIIRTSYMTGLYDSEGNIILPVNFISIELMENQLIKCSTGTKINYLNLATNKFLLNF